MNNFTFNDFYFFLNPIFLLSILWVIFFKLNTNLSKIYKENSNKINIFKNTPQICLLWLYFSILFYLLGNMVLFFGKIDFYWNNHFLINNFNLYLYFIFIFIGVVICIMLKSISKNSNLLKSIDYLFSINNLIILLPIIFFINTIFTFLFLLELITTTLFYKLISSKIWFKNTEKSKILNNNIPQNFLNMLFFQYWVTFFSTIFIIYFYINIFKIYGTSDFFILQYLHVNNHYHTSITDTLLNRFLVWVFIFSILLKLGITPLHLFKIEVYKGIPFLSIFFYTIYYFSVFFIFFLFLLFDYLYSFIPQYYSLLVLLLIIGIPYTIVLLFDVNFLKVFFTYSTIINSIAFLITFIACI